MRFFIRKKRQPPAIIIVALIDVLIVVLIFLMVTTTFKKPQNALKLALPESSQALKSGASENPPLVIIIEPTGNLRFGPDATPMTLDRLKSELQAAVSRNSQTKVALNADKGAPWGQVVKVMDAVKESKVQSLSAFTRQSGKP
ncbi:ExbD/TolR family protein [Pedosphaera parvula]|uniref:Biopolymer transport protein ExbD/TolR n=1 Tax=Pedosphaera parvula (strain Ellin514) TaxID=320771 RepID=B9XNS0_PEDPL|nr:biopolymer transporter ExbD [Pedosphaera parvula]EEF58493.1 Biopolymer transport protein ExbD/TolR [Pedosphaera parvula Ellin514]